MQSCSDSFAYSNSDLAPDQQGWRHLGQRWCQETLQVLEMARTECYSCVEPVDLGQMTDLEEQRLRLAEERDALVLLLDGSTFNFGAVQAAEKLKSKVEALLRHIRDVKFAAHAHYNHANPGHIQTTTYPHAPNEVESQNNASSFEVPLGPGLAPEDTRGFKQISSSTGYSDMQKTPENVLGLTGLSNKEHRLHRGSKKHRKSPPFLKPISLPSSRGSVYGGAPLLDSRRSARNTANLVTPRRRSVASHSERSSHLQAAVTSPPASRYGQSLDYTDVGRSGTISTTDEPSDTLVWLQSKLPNLLWTNAREAGKPLFSLPLYPSAAEMELAERLIAPHFPNDARDIVQGYVERQQAQVTRRQEQLANVTRCDSPTSFEYPQLSPPEGHAQLRGGDRRHLALEVPKHQILQNLSPTSLPPTPLLEGGSGLRTVQLTIPVDDEMSCVVTHEVTLLTPEAVRFADNPECEVQRTGSLLVEPYGPSRSPTLES